MAVEIIENGDLLKCDAKYICHQCNSLTKTGAGLAKRMFGLFPYADIYKKRGGDWTPDKVTLSHSEYPGNILVMGNGNSERFIINMMGQFYPGPPKFPDSKLDGTKSRERYFKSCLDRIAAIKDLESVAFPWKIGCNLAGGNWDNYFKMISNFADHMDSIAKVFIYKPQGTV